MYFLRFSFWFCNSEILMYISFYQHVKDKIYNRLPNKKVGVVVMRIPEARQSH